MSRFRPSKIATAKIRGMTITIYRQSTVIVDGDEVDASCDSPDHTRRSIRIRDGLTPERFLDVLIHELLHACFWDLDESAIAEAATDIAHILTQLGYAQCPVSKKSCSSGSKSKRSGKSSRDNPKH